MKTSLVQPADFAAKFGTDKIKPGPFEYFLTDINVGIIRNTELNMIETVAGPDVDQRDITPEDELVMMNMVCGEYREPVDAIPKSHRPIEEYQYEEIKSKRTYSTIWVVFGILITISLVGYIYVFYGK